MIQFITLVLRQTSPIPGEAYGPSFDPEQARLIFHSLMFYRLGL